MAWLVCLVNKSQVTALALGWLAALLTGAR